MREDYHIHCEFSDDSTEKMERQTEQAVSVGLDEICFTDHVDYGIKRDWDDPRGILYRGGDGANSSPDELSPVANVDYPKYFAKIDAMRERFGDRIRIRAGLEFGIQSITVDSFEKLYERYEDRLDFILFSMHQVDNKEFWNQEFQKGRTQQEYNELYYKEILKTMKMYSHYSVLAHLDLLCRYDQAGIYPFEKTEDLVAEILKIAIRDGKGIEINTSSWKYGLPDTQPSRAILRLYKDLGGKIVTIGSDAHAAAYVGSHVDEAQRILKEEIGIGEICTFVHMKPVFHPIQAA